MAVYPLPTPTTAWPGSEEKIKVLRIRLERREQLHHPDDMQLDFDLLGAPESAADVWLMSGLTHS